MKKILLLTTLAVALGSHGLAQANTGTINFTGNITTSTCEVRPGAGTGGSLDNILVPMGVVSFHDLGSVTEPVGGAVAINLELTCDGIDDVTDVRMSFDPRAGSGLDTDPRLLSVTTGPGAAAGVAVAIVDDSNNIVNLGAGEGIEAKLIIGAGGTATADLSMRAAYVLNGTAPVPGDANAHMPFTLSYF